MLVKSPLFRAALTAAMLATAAGACRGAEIVLDATAAVVNNEIILHSELEQAAGALAAAHRDLNPLAARRAALEQLITRSLVDQAARRQGIDLTDTQLDQALNNVAATNHTTPQQVLASFGAHLDTARQREAFRREIVMSEYRRTRVNSRIRVADAEINAAARQLKQRPAVEPQYHLSQIVVPLSENPNRQEYDTAQARVRELRAALGRGEDFDGLALRFAGGQTEQIGDLGYVPEGRVPLPFVPALLRAHAGEVVGPIRSPLGLHLLKVHEITTDAVPPLRTYDAAHILIKPTLIFSDDAAYQKLLDLKARIEAGSLSFADAARQFSEDTGSAGDGGALGYAPADRYDPAFAQVLTQMNPGSISAPFKSSFGWHIIQLNDVRVDRASDDAYRARARALVRNRKFAEESQLWEKELRANAYIRILDPALTAPAAPQ